MWFCPIVPKLSDRQRIYRSHISVVNRQVLDERIFSHLTTNFYQTSSLYRNAGVEFSHQRALLSDPEWNMYLISNYEHNRVQFLKMINLIEHAIQNFSKVHRGLSRSTYCMRHMLSHVTCMRHMFEAYVTCMRHMLSHVTCMRHVYASCVPYSSYVSFSIICI